MSAYALAPLGILVICDRKETCADAVTTLCGLGHEARGIASVAEIDGTKDHFQPDLIALDVRVGDDDNLNLARRLREVWPDADIVVLSPRVRRGDPAVIHMKGAAPHHARAGGEEAIGAAIRAVARNSSGGRPKPQSFTLDPGALRLTGPLSTVDVSPQECALLAAFGMASGGRLETARMLEVSGKETSKKTLEVQIVRLRKKLKQAGASDAVIKAIRGHGYLLCIPIHMRSAASQPETAL